MKCKYDDYRDCDIGEHDDRYPMLHYRCKYKRARDCQYKEVNGEKMTDENQVSVKDIPPCLGYTSRVIGEPDDYDCGYHVDWVCEECLCNHKIGGWMDPRTPEKYKDEEDDK